MKKLIITSIILILLISCGSKQGETDLEQEKEKIHHVLTEFFNSLADRDWDKYRSHTTEDMILVEHGLLWNSDSLINAMENTFGNYTIKYSFDFIKTHVDGNTAWTVYRNQGNAKSEERDMQFNWIETVIFTKKNGEWKIIEAQSTLVKEPEVIENK